MPWIPIDEWLRQAEEDLHYSNLDDYVPEWQRRLNRPDLFPPLEDLE